MGSVRTFAGPYDGSSAGSSLGEALAAAFQEEVWTHLRAAVAFASKAGVAQIAQDLDQLAASANCELTLGIDQGGTSLEAAEALWQLLSNRGQSLALNHNPIGSPKTIFHPKAWLFSNSSRARLVVGSGNLTQGGLYANTEMSLSVGLDLTNHQDREAFGEAREALDKFHSSGVLVTSVVLQDAHDSGLLPLAAAARRSRGIARSALAALGSAVGSGTSWFTPRHQAAATPTASSFSFPPGLISRRPLGSGGLTARPSVARRSNSQGARAPLAGIVPNVISTNSRLYIEVNPGSKTEIYLAKGVLQDDPAFFGWPFNGRTKPKKNSNIAQPQPDPLPSARVAVYDGSGSKVYEYSAQEVKLWTYSFGPSANDDFRLTIESSALKLVTNGSILMMEKHPVTGEDFAIYFYNPGSQHYAAAAAHLTHRVSRSGRRYGWT